MKKTDTNTSILEQRIKTALDQSSIELDTLTRIQLTKAHTHALSVSTTTSHKHKFWIPILATTCCTILIASLTLHDPKHIATLPEDQTMYELMADGDDSNTIYEPEFYVWVEEVMQHEAANAG